MSKKIWYGCGYSEEFRTMLASAKKYLADEINFVEFRGQVFQAFHHVTMFANNKKIDEVAWEWYFMADLCWNEWGGYKERAISEDELKEWLRDQLF